MLQTTYAAMWWFALGMAFVVVLVVIMLLGFLIAIVKDIDKGVVNVRDTLRSITKNTEDTVLIPQTGDGVDLVLAEGLQHHLFLGRVLESIPTPAPER